MTLEEEFKIRKQLDKEYQKDCIQLDKEFKIRKQLDKEYQKKDCIQLDKEYQKGVIQFNKQRIVNLKKMVLIRTRHQKKTGKWLK